MIRKLGIRMKKSKYDYKYDSITSLSYLIVVLYAIYQIYLLIAKHLLPSILPDVLTQSFNSMLLCDFISLVLIGVIIVSYIAELFLGLRVYVGFIKQNGFIMLLYYLGLLAIIKEIVLYFI